MLLVCIYLCDADRKYLRPLHESAAGRYLAGRGETRVIEVYADAAIAATVLIGDVLTVKAPERYDSLSLKTYEMIRQCAATMTFSQLLKIDVTVARSNFDEPGYEGRSAIDLDDLARYIATMPGDADYCGYMFHTRAGRSGAEKWAAKKGRAIDYERLFGDGPMAPFYSGKCYALSRRFAQFIAARGGLMAAEHAHFFLGAEDVMIGRLFQQFSAELGAP
jgi:hypothetical protein